jgi:putative tryptophan/tyrosine transport system substrate-binding protein
MAMRRRKFITLLGGAVVGWPLAARGQEPGRTYRLGIITPAPRESPPVIAFFDELRRNGFVEGQNLAVIVGAFGNIDDQLAERAAALVNAAPDAILAGPEPPLHALEALTRTVPLIGMVEDMVAAGLVQSLARPAGNITGISLLSPELDGKRQEILIETVPGARRIAAMADVKVTSPDHIQVLQQGARSRGVEILFFGMNRPQDIASAMDAAKAAGVEALNFLASPLFSLPGTPGNRIVMERIAAMRLPAIFQWPETAEAGALLAYGPRYIETYRQRARMVVKILHGAKPADIPVEQPTRFELIINLKAAKEIGYEVPNAIILRADNVIE